MHSSRWWLWNPRLSLVGCKGLPFALQACPSIVPQSKATTFGRITTEECGSPPRKMHFEDLPVENICMGCVLCLCQEIFFWDVVKGASSLSQDLRKMKSSPQNLRLAEQDDKSGYQLHLLRQCSGFLGVLRTNTVDVEGKISNSAVWMRRL